MVTPKEVLADYWLGKEIGRGARSVIYAVRRRRDGLRFAVKYIHVRKPDDMRVVRHLENEFRVLTKLHERPTEAAKIIVRPVEFKKVRRLFKTLAAYLVMEYLDGRSLARHRDYELGDTIRIFLQVCQALEHIHSVGFVHADLKPENILVNEDLSVRLIDFGFAAPVGQKLRGFKGTWGYVAPEQAGGRITERTDVFNLGAALYWVLTGEKVPSLVPHKGDSRGFVPDEKVELIPPSRIKPEIPSELSDLVLRCCSLEEHRRPDVTKVKHTLNAMLLRMEMTR